MKLAWERKGVGDVVGWFFQSRAATVMISTGILTGSGVKFVWERKGVRGTVEVSSFETELLSQHWWLFLAVGNSDFPDPCAVGSNSRPWPPGCCRTDVFLIFLSVGTVDTGCGDFGAHRAARRQLGSGEERSWVLTFLFFCRLRCDLYIWDKSGWASKWT